jgi:hypothetical protein
VGLWLRRRRRWSGGEEDGALFYASLCFGSYIPKLFCAILISDRIIQTNLALGPKIEVLLDFWAAWKHYRGSSKKQFPNILNS